MSGHSFIEERGLDPTMFACDDIWDKVRSHRWNNFCRTPIKPAVDALIYKFYASLKDRDNYKQRVEMITRTLDSFTFKDSDMESIIDYLTEGYGEWTLHANTEFPLKPNKTIMLLMAKMRIQFICTHLVLTPNASDLSPIE
ncbi:hypothetical protein J1N35_037294 [Gossypium stocksii]|uniref:Uncharacterized protein n=1 Tax=Gossypium stocksii TaxID=47602 RepID=A0A9D3UJN0_9ROSI|nr:hypothetical protein J1N35_037294 [Gossypium stocksii]